MIYDSDGDYCTHHFGARLAILEMDYNERPPMDYERFLYDVGMEYGERAAKWVIQSIRYKELEGGWYRVLARVSGPDLPLVAEGQEIPMYDVHTLPEVPCER